MHKEPVKGEVGESMVLVVGEVVHGKVPQALLDGLFDKGQDVDRHRQGAGSSWKDDQ